MRGSFHNTTHEVGQTLQNYEAKAYTQEQQVADFFIANPGTIWTPWEIQSLVFIIPPPPITSIRRAISNLTRDGILTKTNERKVVGIYGRTSYSWTVNLKYYESLMATEVDLAPQEPPEGVKSNDLPEPVLMGTKTIKAENRAKTSSQGKLFDVIPVKRPDTRCALCGRRLTDPDSIETEMGPVCRKKCSESVKVLEPKGRRMR